MPEVHDPAPGTCWDPPGVIKAQSLMHFVLQCGTENGLSLNLCYSAALLQLRLSGALVI